MTQISFNTLYYSACQNIRQVEQRIKRLEQERKKAPLIRKSRVDSILHELHVNELPRLKKLAFNLRINNYPLFQMYSV